MHISALGNKLLQDNKLDNRLFNEERERCDAVIGLALNHIQLLASILEPYMPDTAAGICKQLGIAAEARIPDRWTAGNIAAGHKIGEPALLFTQIKPEKEEEWREAYGGEEVKRQKALAAEKKAAKAAKKAAKKQPKAPQGLVEDGVGKKETLVEETTAAVQNASLSQP